MTNEEAINVINVVRNIILKDPSWLKSFTDLVNEAVDKAIKVLEAQEKAQEVSNNSPELDSDSGDVISKQTILDALDEIESEVADGEGFLYEKWREYFCDLPPAQPEPAIPLQWIEAEIEWLKSLDKAFATSRAEHISAMVNIWKGEQDG